MSHYPHRIPIGHDFDLSDSAQTPKPAPHLRSAHFRLPDGTFLTQTDIRPAGSAATFALRGTQPDLVVFSTCAVGENASAIRAVTSASSRASAATGHADRRGRLPGAEG